MGTPAAAAPLDIYSFCSLLQREVERLHDRLDRLECGEAAATTPRGHHWRPVFDGERFRTEPATPAPTPAFIAATHTPIPLAETLPTAADSPDRYSCTLVVPDSAVGHIVGRGGRGLHQAHDVSGAQLRAYTDTAAPGERRVSIRGTDRQIGEALIALGKRFMRKRVRPRKKRPSPPSEGPAPPPAAPAPPAPAPARMDAERAPRRPGKSTTLRKAGGGTQQPSPLFPKNLPPAPAAATIPPTQAEAPPHPTFRPSSTPSAPSVTMASPGSWRSTQSTARGSPMQIDAVTRAGRPRQFARRGGAVSAQNARIVGDQIYFPGDPEYDRPPSLPPASRDRRGDGS
jgi:hypothetical protein